MYRCPPYLPHRVVVDPAACRTDLGPRKPPPSCTPRSATAGSAAPEPQSPQCHRRSRASAQPAATAEKTKHHCQHVLRTLLRPEPTKRPRGPANPGSGDKRITRFHNRSEEVAGPAPGAHGCPSPADGLPPPAPGEQDRAPRGRPRASAAGRQAQAGLQRIRPSRQTCLYRWRHGRI